MLHCYNVTMLHCLFLNMVDSFEALFFNICLSILKRLTLCFGKVDDLPETVDFFHY